MVWENTWYENNWVITKSEQIDLINITRRKTQLQVLVGYVSKNSVRYKWELLIWEQSIWIGMPDNVNEWWTNIVALTSKLAFFHLAIMQTKKLLKC